MPIGQSECEVLVNNLGEYSVFCSFFSPLVA